MYFWLPVIAALLIALLATPAAIRLAHKVGAVDIPNARKVHTGAMPRLGGLGIYAGFVVGTILMGVFSRQVFALLVTGSMVMAVGLYDDMKGISPKGKLLGQLIAAILLAQSGFYIDFITNPFSGGVISLGIFAMPISVLWMVGMSNAVNLVDGLDGLSAGISAIAALTIAVICFTRGDMTTCTLAAVLAAAAFGFLRYNFHPAKTFMGDCGSLFLGFTLGALAINGFSKGATIISIFIPFLIMGIPIFDTIFAIIRRKFLKKPIFEADKGHLHHCLLSCGLSHSQAVLVIYAICLTMGIAAVLMAVLTTSQAVLVLICIIFLTFWGADKIGVLRGTKKSRLQKQSMK
ncbi:MAG: MraY family glycosyltransferase [Clostridiales bacterium]